MTNTEHISCRMPYRQVYGLVREVLLRSRKNNSYWALRKDDPHDGEVIASLSWRELFGDVLGELPRFVELMIKIAPISGFEDQYSTVSLTFDVSSPLHRGQVNEVVNTVRKDIKLAIGAD